MPNPLVANESEIAQKQMEMDGIHVNFSLESDTTNLRNGQFESCASDLQKREVRESVASVI